MKRTLLTIACLMIGAPALATSPQETQSNRRARPCQGQTPQRTSWPQGTLLWGTKRMQAQEEASSVLASLELDGARLGGAALKGLRIEDGRLVAPSREPRGLVGAVLQGTSSSGQPVEVTVCSAESDSREPGTTWYRIEVWNEKSASWQNPCVATNRVPSPRAVAVGGVWDERGARQESPGKFTFACENGAIAKCISWGYKPWETKDGRSLSDLHQACTRMARADYCGNGRSHTHEDSTIDMYDALGLLTRTTEATAGWDPARASFEAAWAPEGAKCLARTRDGSSVKRILAECPGVFEQVGEDLGEGDHCTVRRKGGSAVEAVLRNHAYGKQELSLSTAPSL